MNIFRRFLSISTENANYKVASRILNRNPRTLEWQNLQWRATGWPLQYPPRDYLYRARLLKTNRHLIAQIDHYHTGNVCVQASTHEWCIRKHLATYKDRSVAYNLGLILAERAEQYGITKIYFGHPQDSHFSSSVRLQSFYHGLVDSNIEFESKTSTKTQETRETIDGINYDEHRKDVRYTSPNIDYPPDVYQQDVYFLQKGLTEKTNKSE